MIRLIELRNEKGLSQRQMAKIFHVSQGTYNNWENDKTEPSIDQLIALADFFDTTVDDLIQHSKNYEELKKEKHLNDLINWYTASKENQELAEIFDNATPAAKNAILTLLKKG